MLKEITFREAIREALREELQRDHSVYLIGEDIARGGGAFSVTQGLWQEFGDERIKDTPISETAIVGTAVGSSLLGLRPVAEIMFCDFLAVCMDSIANQAAKMRYMSGGQVRIPIVIRTTMGAGYSRAAQHSQSLEAWCMHIPGLKVVLPSSPYDAKGLLKSAIRDNNPVIFFEHKGLYNMKDVVPDEECLVPLGVADVKRKGKDATVIATAYMVHEALQAAEELSREGINIEVIDPRTLVPLDIKTILDSIKRTNRAVIVQEACRTGGSGAEIAALLADLAFDYLDAPIRRIATPDVIIPFNSKLEHYVIPDKDDIVSVVRELTQE